MTPSPFLLRTLAAVAPGTRVVDVACGDGVHVDALARLGFDVWASDADRSHVEAARARLVALLGEEEAARRITPAHPDALGYPDAFAPWVVASCVPAPDLAAVFAEAQRILLPGGWLWSEAAGAAPATALLEDRLAADKQAARVLAEAAAACGLAVASRPEADTERGTVAVAFRRVDADTIA